MVKPQVSSRSDTAAAVGISFSCPTAHTLHQGIVCAHAACGHSAGVGTWPIPPIMADQHPQLHHTSSCCHKARHSYISFNIPHTMVFCPRPSFLTPCCTQDLPSRPRRNRRSATFRQGIRENWLSPAHFILPIFVHEGDKNQPIPSMPGINRCAQTVCKQQTVARTKSCTPHTQHCVHIAAA